MVVVLVRTGALVREFHVAPPLAPAALGFRVGVVGDDGDQKEDVMNSKVLLTICYVIWGSVLMFCPGVVHAGQYWWSGAVNSTWDTSSQNWTFGSAVGPATNWPASDSTAEAVFDGSGSEVTVSGTVNAEKLSFNSGGWSVTNGILNLQGLGKVVLGSAVTSSVYSAIGGTNGMTVDGPGVLTLGTANTYTTGGTWLTNQASVKVAGINNTLANGNAGNVQLHGGTIIADWITSETPQWYITVGADGGKLLGFGTAGRWNFPASRLYGTGVLTLKGTNSFGRFSANTQNNFSGKWVIDSIWVDYSDGNKWGNATGDDVITLVNGGYLFLRSAGGTLGSVTQGITIGAGDGAITAAGTDHYIAAKLSGTGRVTFQNGFGKSLTVSNPLNSYSGDTRVRTSSGAQCYFVMGAANVIPGGSGKGNVIIENAGSGAVLDLNGCDQSINGLTNIGTSTFVDNRAAGTAATLTVGGNDATSTFAGVIKNSGSGATLALTKIGSGTLTLSAVNTYSGVTTVSGGVLKLTNAQGLSTNTVVKIASGASCDLAFTGTNTIRELWVNGAMLNAGVYGAGNRPGVLSGTGYYKSLGGPYGSVMRFK